MEYMILQGSFAFSRKDFAKNLAKEVNEKIKEGWKPLGGISVDDNFYYQAMTKD